MKDGRKEERIDEEGNKGEKEMSVGCDVPTFEFDTRARRVRLKSVGKRRFNIVCCFSAWNEKRKDDKRK